MQRGIKVLKTGYEIKDDFAVITETIEKTVSVTDLQREIQQHTNEQQRLVQQMEETRKRYDQIEALKNQVNGILSDFTVTLPEGFGGGDGE